MSIAENNRPAGFIDKVPDFSTEEVTKVAYPTYEFLDNKTVDRAHSLIRADIYLDTTAVTQATQEMKYRLEQSEDAADQNTNELMHFFPPERGVQVGDRQFYLSSVFGTEQGRKQAIGYTTLDNGIVAPRLFYKSRSDGLWRASPQFITVESESGDLKSYFSKGETMVNGYVRETRIDDRLQSALEDGETIHRQLSKAEERWALEHFDDKRLGKTNTYLQEAFEVNVQGFEQARIFSPGHGFKSPDGRPAREVMRGIEIPKEREPDFNNPPQKTEARKHELLGDMTIETYISKDGALAWNMAYTSRGEIWVNGITTPGEAEWVNSYGTDDEVLTAGVYDNKPIEYIDQVQGLEEGIDYTPIPNTQYAVLKVLDNLPVIRQFRDQKGLPAAT